MTYARRRDENHGEIEAALRQMLGDHVTDSSAWAGGAGDLFISFGGDSGPAYCCFVEIKRDAKATYTAHQIRFQKTHPGCVYRIETVDEAIRLAQYVRGMVRALSAVQPGEKTT